MVSVKFMLVKNGKESNLKFILASFYYDNGQRLRYSCGEGIDPVHWDAVKQRAKVTRANPGLGTLNLKLDSIEKDILRIYHNCQLQGTPLSPAQFKTELDILQGRVLKKPELGLFSFIADYISSSQKSKAVNTIKIYRQVERHLKEYQEDNRKNLAFEQLDYNFSQSFYLYLLQKEFTEGGISQIYSHNYVAKVLSALKAILNEAMRKGIVVHNDFIIGNWFKIGYKDADTIYLTDEEVELLYNLDFSKNLRLEKARDLFVLECLTGLRYSDVTNITQANIVQNQHGTFIKMVTMKTGKIVVIPLRTIARNIIQKYEGKYPTISNQKYNQYIKEFCQLAGFTDEVITTENREGRTISRTALKYELISSHTARRSFATNAIKAGIPALQVMRITGHTKEASFMKYIRITMEENAELLAKHDYFNDSAKLKIVG